MTQRDNRHDKFICTFFPGRNEDESYDEGFDYCSWRIPDEENYGEFFICFAGQHEIGGSMFFLVSQEASARLTLARFFRYRPRPYPMFYQDTTPC